jgi:plastocyanin
MRRSIVAICLVFAVLAAPALCAAELPELRLTIENHRFAPAELKVPAGQKVKLIVENRDATPEEFESYELNREKVVAGGASIIVFVGPLEKGRYKFFGDFHQESAQGAVLVD